MATPFSVTPNIGADFNSTTTATALANGQSSDARLGEQRFGSNGRLYVYAQANANINAGVTVASVNATTFLATATGGAYTSPPVAMVAGDRGWFHKASV